VTPPIRTKPSARFIKSRAKLGEPIATRTDKALRKFHESPERPGLNFEAVKNLAGFFTIRVNRSFRIMLEQREDEDGPYFLIVDVASHDDTYS
jgi:mRNA-degrading endonuclease RelE of RelBE toxin-antitoxin system